MFFDYDRSPGYQGPGGDTDHFIGWARWLGTSFSTPLVTGALAREMISTGCSAAEAVARVVDDPALTQIPLLGTVVNVA